MSGDNTAPDSRRKSSAKFRLRTYSRHGRVIKRRFSDIPEYLTRCDDTSKGGVKKGPARLSDSELHKHRKESLSSASSLEKSPTDLFWEHLCATAPSFTRLQEQDHLKKTASPDIDQADRIVDATIPDKKPSNMAADGQVEDKHGEDARVLHHQQSLKAASENIEQDNDGCKLESSDKDLLQPQLIDNSASASIQKFKIKRGSLLCMSSSPAMGNRKVTRHYPDVDESLSAVESSPVRVQTPLVATNVPGKASDFNEFKGLRVTKKTRSKHPFHGFESPAGPWPIPSPNSRRKYANFKEFKDIKAAETNSKHANDGFERDEARLSFPGKKRRVDSSEPHIGSLELTQKGVVTQKMEGPTWLRGQKKPRVSTAPASFWSKRQYFGTSHFQIESEESFEAVDDKQPESAEPVTRVHSKRRISIMSVDADPHVTGDDDDQDDFAYGDAEVAASPHAERGKAFPYSCDADEPLELLVFPFDKEDEADFTVPRIDTPDPGAGTDGESVAQLPPKRWTLNRQDDDQGMLALRPNPGAWRREFSNVPATSDL